MFKFDLGGEVVDRCPNALAKNPFVMNAWRCYSAYKRGITPTGSLSHETTLYHNTMILMERWESEAENWYVSERDKQQQRQSKQQRKGVRGG